MIYNIENDRPSTREEYVKQWRAVKDKYAVLNQQIAGLLTLLTGLDAEKSRLMAQYQEMAIMINLMTVDNIDPMMAQMRYGENTAGRDRISLGSSIGLGCSIENNFTSPNTPHTLFHILNMPSVQYEVENNLRYPLQSVQANAENKILEYWNSQP
jgi:hypothetical protein